MARDKWRLIKDGAATAAWNMALDEALLESVCAGASLPVLRLYRWSPAAVTLGCFQKGPRIVNLAACETLGYDVVRRCTGGRAVLHDQEATYAIVAAEGYPPFPRTVSGTYQVIAEVLGDALHGLGIPTGMMLQATAGTVKRSAVEESACFTAPSAFEQIVKCCKIIGSAQRRRDGAFLQHGSIPVELEVARLFSALDCEGQLSSDEGGRLLAQRVGWLNRFLQKSVTVSEVEDAIVKAFARNLGLEFVLSKPSASELARADLLLREKYANPVWNLSGLQA